MAILSDTLGDIGRMREIAGVLTRHGFGEFLERVNLGRFIPGRVTPPADPSDEASAERLVKAFEELGPSFIKFGQILSTRPDVLPLVYVKALQTLQDRVAPVGFADVKKAIEAEFARPLEDLFDRFEEAPIASASIGQVHRAYGKDGRKLAVKIKRPGIDEMIRADVNLLYGAARLIESVIDLSLGYTPTEIVADFDRAMRMELDFGYEAANARKFAANFDAKSYIQFPEVFDSLSGRSVMSMAFIEAVKISDTFSWPEEKRKIIADRFIDAGVQMVFQDGFFHGDPHPGNVFVDADCNIIFLDLGLAGSVPKYLMDALLRLVVAVAMKDSATVARIIYKLGAANQRVNLADLKNDLDTLLDRFLSQNLGEIQASEVLSEMMERGAKHGVKHPTELAGLAKAILNFEGVVRGLYPELDLMAVAKPYASQYFTQRMTFDSLKPEFTKRASELFGLLEDLPLQVSQLMMDLEKGRVNVTVSSPDLRSLQAALRSLAVTIFLGMVAGAFLLGGFVLIADATIGPPNTVVAIIAFALSLVTGGMAFFWHLIAIRLRRPKLTDFLKKR